MRFFRSSTDFGLSKNESHQSVQSESGKREPRSSGRGSVAQSRYARTAIKRGKSKWLAAHLVDPAAADRQVGACAVACQVTQIKHARLANFIR